MKKRIIILLFCFIVILTSASNNHNVFNSPIMLDYTNHIAKGEDDYITILGELTSLQKGEKVFVSHDTTTQFDNDFNFKSPYKDKIWGYDLRSIDLSKKDLDFITDINDVTYNTVTKWPEDFKFCDDPSKILEMNKNPGLGINILHQSGITGNEVGIAIIDQPLLLDHEEYFESLMLYEKIHCFPKSSQMHGSAVASIAAGKSVGVAPGAKIYYIATTYGHYKDNGFEFNASILADCIMRVLEINKILPLEQKIRVVSISKGYHKDNLGYQKLTQAIQLANKQNIFVITTTPHEFYNFHLFGLDRDYLKDPDDTKSYRATSFCLDSLQNTKKIKNDVFCVPIGARTVAGNTSVTDYQLSNKGGMSWAVPWLAGLYALCCQVDPQITPNKFIEILSLTGSNIYYTADNIQYLYGKIINPIAVLDKLLHK